MRQIILIMESKKEALTHYAVVSATSEVDMMEHVNQLLQYGYRLVGGVSSVFCANEKRIVFTQALETIK